MYTPINKQHTTLTGHTRAHISVLVTLISLSLLPRLSYANNLVAKDNTQQKNTELATLLTQALLNNPELHALQENIKAAKTQVVQAGAWKDPMLSVLYNAVPIDSFAQGEEPMSSVMVKVGQTFPWFGKIDKRITTKKQGVAVQKQRLLEAKQQLRGQVKIAFYKLGLVRQLKAITEEHIGLVKQLLMAVRIKYEVGRALQQNMLRLEVLRDLLSDNLHDFTQQDVALTAHINALIHAPLPIVIQTPDSFTTTSPQYSQDMLLKKALQNRSALKQLDAMAKQFAAASISYQANNIPDINIFAAYAYRQTLRNSTGSMGGKDLASIGLSVPLPVFYDSRDGAQAREMDTRRLSTLRQRESMVDKISAAIGSSLSKWQRSAQKVVTYQDLLVPAAHQTLDATFASYQVDRTGFLPLFEAEVELLKFEKTIHIATVDALIAKTNIETLTGKDL